MRKRSVPSRDPLEFNQLIKRWKSQAANEGHSMKETDIKRQLAFNMKDMIFRPEIRSFKKRDLYDVFYPPKRMRKNKRGIADVLWLVGIFFVIAVMTIMLTYGLGEFNNVLQNETWIDQTSVKTPMENFTNRIPRALDSGLILAYLAAHIGIIFLGLLLRSHPIVFPILMLALLVLTMGAGYMANAFNEIASTPELTSTADNYPMTSWILDHYLMVTLMFGFIDILAFAGLSTLAGGGGGSMNEKKIRYWIFGVAILASLAAISSALQFNVSDPELYCNDTLGNVTYTCYEGSTVHVNTSEVCTVTNNLCSGGSLNGTGGAGLIAYWENSTQLTSDVNMYWNDTSNTLFINSDGTNNVFEWTNSTGETVGYIGADGNIIANNSFIGCSAIGLAATCGSLNAQGAASIGAEADAQHRYSLAAGYQSIASNQRTVAIRGTASGVDAISIGAGTASGGSAVQIGGSAASGAGSVAIRGASMAGDYGTSIGHLSSGNANCDYGNIYGYRNNCQSYGSTVLGRFISSFGENSTVLGNGVSHTVRWSPNTPNVVQIGTNANTRFTAQQSGNIDIGTNNNDDAQLHIEGDNAAEPVLIVEGAAAQADNLQEWQNVTGDELSSIQADGDFDLNGRNLVTDADGNSYIDASQNNELRFYLNGGLSWLISTSQFYPNSANGPRILAETATTTNPTYVFSTDFDTGIGYGGANNLSLITGGVEGYRLDNNQNSLLNIPYGEMFVYNESGITITQPTEEKYENFTNMTLGRNNGFTLNTNKTLTATYGGTYKVDYSVSFKGSTGKTHGICVGINGDVERQCYSQRKLGSNDVGNTGGTCFIEIDNNDNVTLMADPEDAVPADITIIGASLNLVRIGE